MIWVPADPRGREIEGRIRDEIAVFDPARAEFLGLKRRHKTLGYILTVFDQLQSIRRARRGCDRLALIEPTLCLCFITHRDHVSVEVANRMFARILPTRQRHR